MSEARGRLHPEHAEMIARVEGVHRDLRELLDELGRAPDFTAIAEGLCELPQKLADHFAEEESFGGLYDGLRHRRPAVEGELTRLRDEHSVLRELLDALVERVRAPGAGSGAAVELASLREQASIFIELQREHERVETRLVSEIYYSEDGVSG